MYSKEQIIKLCNTIIADMQSDASSFDGKPFNGRTVGEYLGNQAAAISALAIMIKEVVCTK